MLACLQVAEQSRMTHSEAYEAVKTMMNLDASVDVCNDDSLATALATRARRILLAEGDAAAAMDTLKKGLVLLNTVLALTSVTGDSSVAVSVVCTTTSRFRECFGQPIVDSMQHVHFALVVVRAAVCV